MLLTVDLHEHLVQMPAPSAGFQTLDPPFSDLRSKHRTEPMPPKSNGLVAHVDAAFVEQIFHIAQRQRETDVQHYRQADDLTARFEIAKWIRFCHPTRLQSRPARLKLICSDSAVVRASVRACITRGRRNSLKRASNAWPGIPPDRRHRLRSRNCVRNLRRSRKSLPTSPWKTVCSKKA